MTHSPIRYLAAKRTVDDRSLSRRVRNRLCTELPPAPAIFEPGCGTGVTVPRLLEWGVTTGSYRGVDTLSETIAHARAVRPAELRRMGYDVVETDTGFRVGGLTVSFEAGDALVRVAETGPHDLVVAQQFLDLVDIDHAVEIVTAALSPGGLAYLPLTFDGVTLFEPPHPADEAMLTAYHATMDQRAGSSRAGRDLFDTLQSLPGTVLAVDAADAIVRPRDGEYPADERFVLESILSFIDDEVDASDVPARDDWLRTRRQQVRDAELLYVAHRYDVLYQTASG
jgi:hypothetical protein